MSSKNRARVIYQSEALYVGTVDATGNHFSTSTDWDTRAGHKTHATYQGAVDEGEEIRTGIQQLHRIQSANYSFSVNRQDVNQFGQLGRIDAVAIDPPTVTLDFSYYVTNGLNERLLGMNVSGDKSALASEIVDGLVCGDSVSQDGKNFFILTTCEGQDAVNNKDEEGNSVIALGNGYVSNYSVEAAVGGMPTANVTVDGLNLRAYHGTTGLASPAINTNFGTPVNDVEFNVPPAVSGVLNDSDDDSIDSDDSHGWSCLRPGDITMSLGTDGSAAEFNLLPSADAPEDFTAGSAHVQSFSIDVPLSRSVLNRLGSPYGYARAVDYPVNINVSVSAIVSDLKAGKLDELLWSKHEEHDLVFTLREPEPYGTGKKAIEYRVKGALLEGESFSSSIGDNKTVDLTFTAQIGGPQDVARGLMVSGSRNALNIDKYLA